ncbi:MAG: AAA family ATPase [Gemmatimonadetes bacterium]|nr:AAA family ATPase [Gemmatimonadota bacterium]
MTVFRIDKYNRRRSLSKSQREHGLLGLSRPNPDPPEITLTEDQQSAVEALLAFEKSQAPRFLLTGFAGTGKTTTLQHWVKASDRKIVLTAPTNKAVRVLREQAGEAGLEVPCMTIHRLLKLRMATDAEEKYAYQYDIADLGSHDVVVVDECSMVGNDPPPRRRGQEEGRGLHDRIVEECEDAGVKVVFVGDPGQLPPVKEGRESPSFATPLRASLTTVVRQALESPIIRLATYVRGEMEGRNPEEPELGEGVRFVEHDWEFEKLVCGAYADDPGHATRHKALAWTNKRVNALNDAVRASLWGPSPDRYREGERHVALQPVIDFEDNRVVQRLATDEDAVIAGLCEADHPRYPQYRCLLLDMEGAGGRFSTWVVHPDDERAWEDDLRDLADAARHRRARWEPFWELKDAFAHLRPHYAMTCHKSQGSTYDHVFVDSRDVLKNSSQWEAWRCLYVACTRAAKSLTVLR